MLTDSLDPSSPAQATFTSAPTLSSASSHYAAEDTPIWIGHYHLLRKLGEGGMGAVWLAEQDEPVQRQVALKLIKAAIRDPSALQRFDLERQALAVMNHPAIAKVFDAGATAEGQPYFVMEYVSGLPISLYCRQKGLTVRQRLELMIAVCEGVQHAHQKAIIHRDLKPSNILVTEIDGKPVPRIIDFGIAKALSTAPTSIETETLFTGQGVMVGTLGYMSPEQADPGTLDIDTRTDVYSLGAVLYELLTGSLPWTPKQRKNKSLYQVLHQLREQDPERPSTRLKAAESSEHGNEQGVVQKSASSLEGDMDWIAMKAIDRDRERRYNSPLELAADLGRYLNHEPIIARPPSLLYLTGKFVRRNRLAVAFVSALALVIVGFAITMTIERNRANREAEVSNEVTKFMTNVFNISNPNQSHGNSVTARELLDKASAQIGDTGSKDPLVQARMMAAMGNTYLGLGLYKQARTMIERADAIQARLLGPESPETLVSQSRLGYLDEAEGKFVDGEKLLRQTLAAQQKTLGPGSPQSLDTAGILAGILSQQGKFAEAEKLMRQTVAERQKRQGAGDPATLRAKNDLAVILREEGQYAEVERLDREIMADGLPQLGPRHPTILSTMNNQAMTLQAEGKYAEAEPLLRETLLRVTQVYGPESRNALAVLSNLGLILSQQGKLNEAETMQRDEMARTLAVMGPEHPDTLESMDDLAVTLGKEKKFPESEELLHKELGIKIRTLGPSFPDTITTMDNLAGDFANEQRAGEAIALYEQAVNDAAQAERPTQAQAHYAYGSGLSILGRPNEAFEQLQQAQKLGFADADQLATDDDFKPLRADPRFPVLLATIRQQAVAPR
jgi:serine/threonine protein kinase/Flp pilus assembly protein TadD